MCKIFYTWNIGKIFYIFCTLPVPMHCLSHTFMLSQISLHNPTHPQPFSLSHHWFHRLHHHPSPIPPYSAPPITSSSFTIATHHQLHVVNATTNSQVLSTPLSILLLLQDYLARFLEVGLWWELLLVGRRWIWWSRLYNFWLMDFRSQLFEGFWVSVVWSGGLMDSVGGVVFHES